MSNVPLDIPPLVQRPGRPGNQRYTLSRSCPIVRGGSGRDHFTRLSSRRFTGNRRPRLSPPMENLRGHPRHLLLCQTVETRNAVRPEYDGFPVYDEWSFAEP
jgi:hypothetical protein